MSETRELCTTEDPRTNLASFMVRPPLRCYEITNSLTGARCGDPAVFTRPAAHGQARGFFCREHSLAGDEQIRDDAVFRRVSITVDVLFSGVSWDRSKAQSEALSRLERCVAEAGGVINLHSCHSAMGYVGRPPGRRGANRGAGES